jgi:UDP-N-acetylmuramyl pentapeptide phosphotransferase/UDP-N-acetylglucosamine-1-phosphate transferase
MEYYLLVALAGAFVLSLIGCGIALRLAPNFRSGERKEGFFRADQSMGSSGSGATLHQGRRRPPSAELPLVGSRGMMPAMLVTGGATGWLMHFSLDQWILLGIMGAGLVGLWLVGFIDDWRKVYSGSGMREITKFLGVAIVSVGVAIALERLVEDASIPYSPYLDIPGLGWLIRHVAVAWPIFFVLIVLAVTSTTSLAVDFSDGLDGLAAGLMLPTALAFAIIILNEHRPDHYPLVIASLALAGAALGFLPWNWPSSWKGRGTTPRRARMIMGDSGSLSLGGMLALIALVDRQELLLIFLGGAFVLEGLSAVIQSRLLVRFYRRFLRVERFAAQNVWFPHTEFPLPFLATPMHHHFELLGWDRRRLVYGAWMVAILFAALSVASVLAPFTWERYLTRLAVVLVALALWQSGHYTRGYFLGTVPTSNGTRLALFYGYPYQLFRRPLYALVEQVEAADTSIVSPVERSALWTRMSVFDARAALGFYCYRAGYYTLAREQWERIPAKNLEVRPEILLMLNDVRRRQAVVAESAEKASEGTIETAVGAEPSPADTIHALPMSRPQGGAVTSPLRQVEQANQVNIASLGQIAHMAPGDSGIE